MTFFTWPHISIPIPVIVGGPCLPVSPSSRLPVSPSPRRRSVSPLAHRPRAPRPRQMPTFGIAQTRYILRHGDADGAGGRLPVRRRFFSVGSPSPRLPAWHSIVLIRFVDGDGEVKHWYPVDASNSEADLVVSPPATTSCSHHQHHPPPAAATTTTAPPSPLPGHRVSPPCPLSEIESYFVFHAS